MAKIGRPRKDEEDVQKQRQIRMDDKTWDRVGKAADEDETTRSAVVREAVVKHLDERDQQRG